MFLHKTQTYTYTQYLWLPFRSWTFDQYDFIGSPTKLTSLCRFSTILVSKRWPCWVHNDFLTEENMENWKKKSSKFSKTEWGMISSDFYKSHRPDNNFSYSNLHFLFCHDTGWWVEPNIQGTDIRDSDRGRARGPSASTSASIHSFPILPGK